MQRTRNILWLGISYGLVTVLAFDPTKLLLPSQQRVSILADSTVLVVGGVALLVGMASRSKVLNALSTFAHELGHAVAVGLTGGSVQSLRMQLDTSGSTSWSGKPSRLTRALVAVAGPLANAVIFGAILSALSKGFSPSSLFALSAVLALILITSVRNLWGWVVSIALISLMAFLGLALSGSAVLSDFAAGAVPTNLLLLIVLALVAFNAGVGLRYSWSCRNPKSTDMDEYKFAKAFGLPRWLGGYVILIANLGIIALSFMDIAVTAL